MKLTLAAALLVLLVTGTALADVVVLADGRRLEGETSWTPDGKQLRIKLKMGELLVAKKDVVRIEKKQSPAKEYQARRDTLDPDDLEAVIALATFCAKHESIRQHAPRLLVDAVTAAGAREKANAGEGAAAKRARTEAFRLRGRAEAALQALDYHLVDGKWLAPEDYYPPRGFVKVSGSWVSADEAKRLAAAKGKRDAARQARKDGVKAKRVGRAQGALDDAEAVVDKADRRIDHYESEQVRVRKETVLSKAELDRRHAERVEAEGLERVARSAYDAWNSRRCDCSGGFCRCDWQPHLNELQRLHQEAKKLAADTRRLETETQSKVDGLARDALTARKLLKEARRILAKAERALKAARKKVEKARGD